MKKIRLEKGITLIALIITIVILLIIAVVTMGSIKDSKIIGHAQDASNDYTIAQEKEQIGLALSEWQIQKVLGEKSFREVVESSLKGKATVSGPEDGPLTITMKTGNQYIVTDSGEILPPTKGISLSPTSIIINEGETEKITVTLLGGLQGDITYSSSNESVATVNSEGEVTGEGLGSATITVTCGEYSATCKVGVSNIKEYLFGTALSGRLVTDFVDINNSKLLNEKEPKLLGSDTMTLLNLAQIGDWGYAYFEYQGIYYKVRVNMTTSELDGVPAYHSDANYGLVAIANAETKVGKTVSFDGKTWTIIYDDNTNGLQMLCNEGLYLDRDAYNALGRSDVLNSGNWDKLDKTTDEFKLSDLNGNKSIDTDLEKALYSYNKAIDTLNTLCDNFVTDASFIKEVRCVGTNPIDKDSENETEYTSTNLENWPTTSAGILNGKAKGSDENYILDFDRILALRILKENDSFWLGSRLIYEGKNEHDYSGVNFSIRVASSELSSVIMCVREAETRNISPGRKVRPVVVLNSDANLVTDTTGSADYILQ